MGKEVASLYATLGLDTSKFQTSLKDSKGKLGQLGDSFQKLTGFSLANATAIGLAGKALQSIV